MNIKIYGGTARDDKPLCLSCKYYSYRKTNTGKEIKLCTDTYSAPVLIKDHIVECNSYLSHNHVSLSDMKEQAHILRVGSSGIPVGFMPAKEYEKKYGEDVYLDEF